MLLAERRKALENCHRVEFGESILPKLIYAFCDSQYLTEEIYADTLAQLQEIFYQFKNETMDQVSDEEILNFMTEQFNGVCRGSTEYLAETCLERFARAVREGYRGFLASGGEGEYEQFSEETHWEQELYVQALEGLAD